MLISCTSSLECIHFNSKGKIYRKKRKKKEKTIDIMNNVMGNEEKKINKIYKKKL